ncbi:hypothetical protein BCR39DRAFT_555357 [Naematelia encephala]|uniref:Uncharacterized protein n=1 Tax=Naematelia encephala TaxID=71784 RepID=A0A1Y2AD76_9TREE|nr:hypothetical protein BCR39DRAFT_555357 [Naematelia encephala]
MYVQDHLGHALLLKETSRYPHNLTPAPVRLVQHLSRDSIDSSVVFNLRYDI